VILRSFSLRLVTARYLRSAPARTGSAGPIKLGTGGSVFSYCSRRFPHQPFSSGVGFLVGLTLMAAAFPLFPLGLWQRRSEPIDTGAGEIADSTCPANLLTPICRSGRATATGHLAVIAPARSTRGLLISSLTSQTDQAMLRYSAPCGAAPYHPNWSSNSLNKRTSTHSCRL